MGSGRVGAKRPVAAHRAPHREPGQEAARGDGLPLREPKRGPDEDGNREKLNGQVHAGDRSVGEHEEPDEHHGAEHDGEFEGPRLRQTLAGMRPEKNQRRHENCPGRISQPPREPDLGRIAGAEEPGQRETGQPHGRPD